MSSGPVAGNQDHIILTADVRSDNKVQASAGRERRFDDIEGMVLPVSHSSAAVVATSHAIVGEGLPIESTRQSQRSPPNDLLGRVSQDQQIWAENATPASMQQGSVKDTILFPVRKFSASLDFLVGDTSGRKGVDLKSRSFSVLSSSSSSSSSSSPSASSSTNSLLAVVDPIRDDIGDKAANTQRDGDVGSSARKLSREMGDRLLLLAGRLLEFKSPSSVSARSLHESNMGTQVVIRDKGSGSDSIIKEGDEPKREELDDGDEEDFSTDEVNIEQAKISCADRRLETTAATERGEAIDLRIRLQRAEEQLKVERRLRTGAAKRLLLLSNILSGKYSLSEYDSLESL